MITLQDLKAQRECELLMRKAWTHQETNKKETLIEMLACDVIGSLVQLKNLYINIPCSLHCNSTYRSRKKL